MNNTPGTNPDLQNDHFDTIGYKSMARFISIVSKKNAKVIGEGSPMLSSLKNIFIKMKTSP